MPAKIIRWRQPPGSLSTPPPLSTPLRQATSTLASLAPTPPHHHQPYAETRKYFGMSACQTGRPNHPGRFPPSRKPFQGQVKTQESTLRKSERDGCIPSHSVGWIDTFLADRTELSLSLYLSLSRASFYVHAPRYFTFQQIKQRDTSKILVLILRFLINTQQTTPDEFSRNCLNR